MRDIINVKMEQLAIFLKKTSTFLYFSKKLITFA